MTDPRVEKTDWRSQGPTLLQIRHAVFVDEQGVPPELEHDEQDADALHLLAMAADGTPVGTARLLPDGHIGRMAVLAPYRNQGVGTLLLESLITQARQYGLVQVFLNAQLQAVPFYQCLGFQAVGDVFDDAGIPHRRMLMNIGADQR